MALEVVQIVNEPVASNCFLLFDREVDNDCLVVDPGCENPDTLERKLLELDLFPKFIVLTHEHFDHVWGCNALIQKYHSKIICSAVCSEAIQDAKKNHSVFYNQRGLVLPAADICIEDINFQWEWHNLDLLFFITEGHTNAGICFVVGNYLFTGDTLIKGIRTVTKLYCGSKEKLVVSIEKIKTMQGKGLRVCPGHGDEFDLDTYDLNKAL